ncbi:MAG: decaprenylphospho-beta-D-ribofuranose 2-oxidase, partial [Nocardioidaceae bacterium]|nr:decaprenylphospho-beta-D-ribofuranose 2-oxidase [Nocardioidaceae bacterium]
MTPLLTGWGRTAPTSATLVEATVADVPALLRDHPARGVIARGLGRSYGDAAQNAGGTVLAPIPGPTTIHTAEDGSPLVTAAAGTSLHDLMATLLAERLFVPVTPGTRYVTLGGAVAADIHGKNHHRDGSFGEQLVSLDLVTADGGLHTIGPDTDPTLFWATVGGMGLTGVILGATLQLLRVETAYVLEDIERCSDVDDCLARMSARDDEYRYSVAWIDCLARGSQLGRSVLMRGDHAPREALPARTRGEPLERRRGLKLPAPPWAPNGLLRRETVAAFNELYFRRAPREERGRLVGLDPFFYPLDAVEGWNRMYGSRGFLQYQFVVPFGSEDALREALERFSGAGVASFLAVLKRFGTGSGMISFPMPGWTLALDMPAGDPTLGPLLDGLDALVAEAG